MTNRIRNLSEESTEVAVVELKEIQLFVAPDWQSINPSDWHFTGPYPVPALFPPLSAVSFSTYTSIPSTPGGPYSSGISSMRGLKSPSSLKGFSSYKRQIV
jgi:hypothetical protein